MQADLGKNYFELFGLAAQFDIDSSDLSSRYRELQRRFHPDRFAAAPEAERRRSVQMTAQINAAFQTLRDPVDRGRYLLKLQGVDTGEDTDTHMSTEFLMEQMQLREDLEQAQRSDDPSGSVDRLRQQVSTLMESRMALLRDLFARNTDSARLAARAAVRELQFLKKILNEMDVWDR